MMGRKESKEFRHDFTGTPARVSQRPVGLLAVTERVPADLEAFSWIYKLTSIETKTINSGLGSVFQYQCS